MATTTATRRERPEPSQRAQRILTIVFAVAIVGILVALIVAGAGAPRGTSPQEPPAQGTPP